MLLLYYYILLKLDLTIPLSNATAEQSFRAPRRVKTYLRNSLKLEHLDPSIAI